MSTTTLSDTLLKAAVENFLTTRGYQRLDIRAALFDMDGTLYDSMPRHAAAWKQMCDENGILADIEEFFAFEGRTGADTINIMFNRQYGHPATDRQIKELYQRKTAIFRSLQPAPKMPGAESLTRQCADNGLNCIVVTGSGQRSLIDNIISDFPGVFHDDRIITSHDVSHGKPHPEPYLKGLKLAGVAPNQAIVIENAPLGVAAGADAGIFTIAVTTGPIPATDMANAGASIIFNSMQECADSFARLLYYMTSISIN